MSSTVLPLARVGEIRGGYVAPQSGASGRDGRFLALHAGDVAPGGRVAWSVLSRVTPVFDASRYLIGEGDVLVPLRSVRPTAVVARGVPPDVVAVGHWAILSPNTDLAEPDYLAWYLNHPTTATRLGGLMKGTSLRFLSITALRDFEIELPPLELQRRIARAHALSERVADLEQQLADARRRLVDAFTMDALRSAAGPETDA